MFPRRILTKARKNVLLDSTSQITLVCAINMTYYAMFHTVSATAADAFIGEVELPVGKQARMQVYRSLDHRPIRSVCKNEAVMRQFSPENRKFAELLVEMQAERQRASYDPSARFDASLVLSAIDSAETAIRAFNAASEEERKAFIALILFKTRRQIPSADSN